LKKNNFIVKLPARQRGDGSSILWCNTVNYNGNKRRNIE
jgi:hypothetical protein